MFKMAAWYLALLLLLPRATRHGATVSTNPNTRYGGQIRVVVFQPIWRFPPTFKRKGPRRNSYFVDFFFLFEKLAKKTAQSTISR